MPQRSLRFPIWCCCLYQPIYSFGCCLRSGCAIRLPVILDDLGQSEGEGEMLAAKLHNRATVSGKLGIIR